MFHKLLKRVHVLIRSTRKLLNLDIISTLKIFTISKYKGEEEMHNFQNDLQTLGMDHYQVGELVPINPQSQDPRLWGMRCGGFRCGGFHCGGFRCGGFRCGGFGFGGCFGSCFGCFGVGFGFGGCFGSCFGCFGGFFI